MISREEVEALAVDLTASCPANELDRGRNHLAASALRALLADRDSLHQALQHADALMDVMTPGVDTELTDAQTASLWNATSESIKKILEQPK